MYSIGIEYRKIKQSKTKKQLTRCPTKIDERITNC